MLVNVVTNLGFHKIREISWVAEELLASLEEIFSMELVGFLFICECH